MTSQFPIPGLNIYGHIIVSMVECVAIYAKQKHFGCKKVRGQSEAAFQIGICDQKL